MQWTSKYCTFFAEKRGYLLNHCHLKHGCHTLKSPFACLYRDCLCTSDCTLKSFNALQVHLSTWHTQKNSGKIRETTFRFQWCKSFHRSRLCFFFPICDNIFSRSKWSLANIKTVTGGVLNVSEDLQQPAAVYAVHLHPISTAIILKGGTAMDNLRDFPQAVCLLFRFMYAPHLNYSKCIENTFRCI